MSIATVAKHTARGTLIVNTLYIVHTYFDKSTNKGKENKAPSPVIRRFIIWCTNRLTPSPSWATSASLLLSHDFLVLWHDFLVLLHDFLVIWHDFFDTASLTRLLWPASSPSGRGQGGRLHHLPADPGAHHPAAGLSGDHGRRHPRPVRPVLRGLWHGGSASARPWPAAAGSKSGGDDRANSGPGQAQTG